MAKACFVLMPHVHCVFLGLSCTGDQAGGKDVVAKHQLALIPGIPVEWP